jgi:hypothetical protein
MEDKSTDELLEQEARGLVVNVITTDSHRLVPALLYQGVCPPEGLGGGGQGSVAERGSAGRRHSTSFR